MEKKPHAVPGCWHTLFAIHPPEEKIIVVRKIIFPKMESCVESRESH
jgi:hypothetical protein